MSLKVKVRELPASEGIMCELPASEGMCELAKVCANDTILAPSEGELPGSKGELPGSEGELPGTEGELDELLGPP